ncbi:MAG: carboxypeptidase regulatory-like domain-containing protein [Acidobacteria bacterium]|nr:carboxypeptidase regulatory-like domain-containing protein [Acidobacteriota bacterium]
MKRVLLLAGLGLWLSAGSASAQGVISGTITGPDGKPLRAVFVRAEHTGSPNVDELRGGAGTHKTTSVLSNNQGQYVIDGLTPGSYQVWTWAIGYRGTPARTTITVQQGQTGKADFKMRTSPVQWHELSKAQAAVLLPEAPGREQFMTNCMNCHGMGQITGRRDYDGWIDAIDVMRRRGITTVQPQVADEVAKCLAAVLGPDSKTPQSPSQLPAWKEVQIQWSDEALNIVYVDYPVNQGTNRPGTGYSDKAGNVWMEMENGLARLNPATGETTLWQMPAGQGGGIHEVLPLPDGSVWLTVTTANKLARFNTRTQDFEIYADPYKAPRVKQIDPNTPIWERPRVQPGEGALGRKHTALADHEGNIWATGRPLVRFNPETKQWTGFPEVPDAYGIAVDQAGNVWFAEFNAAETGSIGKVDPKTGKVTKYIPPPDIHNGRPRRLKIDSRGNIWFGQYFNGSIAKFDPKTEQFTVYKLPGPHPTIYGLGVDHNDNIWGVSHFNEATYRIDPSGRMVAYPSPYISRGTRDLWPDAQGRMWYGAQPEFKVGYFYVRDQAGRLSQR